MGLKRSGKSSMSACLKEGGSSKSVLMSLMLAAITARETPLASWALRLNQPMEDTLAVCLNKTLCALAGRMCLSDLVTSISGGNVAAAVRQCSRNDS